MQKYLSLAVLASTIVLPTAAVNMAFYEPAQDVDAGFQDFLQELYAQTEIPASTDTFTDFFSENGTLRVTSSVAVGAEEIVALKQALMPTDGSKAWNHLPNVTTVFSESDTEKIYYVQGVIQATFVGGNCSQAYFETHFTVAKIDGTVSLITHSGSLQEYDDFLVNPTVSPTDIPCQAV